jgi:hypothetical protein
VFSKIFLLIFATAASSFLWWRSRFKILSAVPLANQTLALRLSRLRFSAIEQYLGRSENTHNFRLTLRSRFASNLARGFVIPQTDKCGSRLLERLKQAQAKIVLSFLKDRRADHFLGWSHDKQIQPAARAGFLAWPGVYHTAACDRNGKK